MHIDKGYAHIAIAYSTLCVEHRSLLTATAHRVRTVQHENRAGLFHMALLIERAAELEGVQPASVSHLDSLHAGCKGGAKGSTSCWRCSSVWLGMLHTRSRLHAVLVQTYLPLLGQPQPRISVCWLFLEHGLVAYGYVLSLSLCAITMTTSYHYHYALSLCVVVLLAATFTFTAQWASTSSTATSVSQLARHTYPCLADKTALALALTAVA